jgi:large subunit ribosomal protein L24
MRIRRGDTVYVRTGEDRGKTGKVLFVNVKKKTVVVEGINMRKRAQRPTQKNPKGGVITIEAPVHVSNLGLYSTTTSGPTRTAIRIIEEGGKKKRVRISKETGEEI